MALLQVSKLVKKYGGITAVNHCSFSVEENSITALIGPNGAGKTTLFDLISGIITPDSGDIVLRGRSIVSLPPHKRAHFGIARTFQAIRIFPDLSVLDNIVLALTAPRYEQFLAAFKSQKKKVTQLHHSALEILDLIHLREKAHVRAGLLSYGQQKLLEIMRAYATGAELFLFDEPAAGVNRTMLHSIITIIKKLKSEGKGVLLIEHDMGFVMSLCDNVIVMDYGREIADGPPSQIQKNPAVLEAYLGSTDLHNNRGAAAH